MQTGFSRYLVAEAGRVRGFRTALIGPNGDALSFHELAEQTRGAAAQLSELGLSQGERVGIAFASSISYVIWFFAVLELGGVAVPLDPKLRPRETAMALDDSSANYVVTFSAGWSDESDWDERPARDRFQELKILSRRKPLSFPAAGDDGIVIAMTSGSSGRPKRILRTVRHIAEDCAHLIDELRLTEADRFLALPPCHHAFGALGLYASLATGGETVLVDRFLPAKVLTAAFTCQPTWMLATPPMLELLSDARQREGEANAFASIRHVICSTGYLSGKVHEAFHRRFGVKVQIQYGSTETLSTTLTRDGNYLPGRVGRPYKGVTLAIFDDADGTLPAGAIGRVGVRGAAICDGYESDSDTLNRIGDFVLPGDRGYLDADGELFIVGRDDIFNIGGNKVARHEVEGIIRAGFDVRDVVVLPHSRAGVPALRAVIEADNDPIHSRDIMAYCKDKLSAYKVPARVDIVRELPRDATGKVSSAELNALLGALDAD